MGKLVLVPTPIGNLEDITFRAVRVLQEAGLILAEDTRKTAILLKRYHINKAIKPFHKFNEHKTLAKIIALFDSTEIIALVSDAGTPGISDPGFLLVRECLCQGIEVECLPGPTALIPALILSGFPCERFIFEGFLPQKKGRLKRLAALKDETRTMLFYESPHRLVKALEQMAGVFGPQRQVAVSRELTKIYEETVRGTLEELTVKFAGQPVKGEIVIALKGSVSNDEEETNVAE